MTKRLTTLCVLFLTIACYAQNIDSAFVEGVWKVENVEASPSKPPFSLMVKSFKNATFTFNKDKTCSIESTPNDSFFSMLTSIVAISSWKVTNEQAKPSIFIGKGERKALEIFVSVKEDETFFELGEVGDERYFLLKVKKK
jgi:hypothetical protein